MDRPDNKKSEQWLKNLDDSPKTLRQMRKEYAEEERRELFDPDPVDQFYDLLARRDVKTINPYGSLAPAKKPETNQPSKEPSPYVDPAIIPCFPRLHLQPPSNEGDEAHYMRLGASLSPDRSGAWVLPATPKALASPPPTVGIEMEPMDLVFYDSRLVFFSSRCWSCHRSFDHCQLAGSQLYDRFRDRSTGLNWSVGRYVRRIDEPALSQITAFIGPEGFHMGYSQTAGFSYYMNHCVHCGCHQGDFPLVELSYGPLHLTDPDDLLRLPHLPLKGPVRFCGWTAHIDNPLRLEPDLVAPPFGKVCDYLLRRGQQHGWTRIPA